MKTNIKELLQQSLDCLEKITYENSDGERRNVFIEGADLNEYAPVSRTISLLEKALGVQPKQEQ